MANPSKAEVVNGMDAIMAQVALEDGRSLSVVNETGLSDDEIMSAVGDRELAAWGNELYQKARSRVESGMFSRAVFQPPPHAYAERESARHARDNDDVVGAWVEAWVSLMFRNMHFESTHAADADYLNQWAAEVDLDSFGKAWARAHLTDADTPVLRNFRKFEFSLRGKSANGNKLRGSAKFLAPTLSILDCQTIVPFDLSPVVDVPERLAFLASEEIVSRWMLVENGQRDDPRLKQFYKGRVVPSTLLEKERHELTQLGVTVENLIELKDLYVFRTTGTKSNWERFSSSRIKRVFHLLDLKQKLMLADLAFLSGAANFILVLRKGTDQHPARPEERASLDRNYKHLANSPVIISDHRLDVQLIAPPQDHVLSAERYESVNLQITTALWNGTGTAKFPGAAKINLAAISAQLEHDRNLFKRAIEKHVVREIVNHPANAGVFKGEPNLVFTPRKVELERDDQTRAQLITLYQQQTLSLTSLLEAFGYDIDFEANRREHDKSYADSFELGFVPNSGKQPGQPGDPTDPAAGETPNQSGKRGGRPVGQRADPAKNQPVTENGNPSTKTPKRGSDA